MTAVIETTSAWRGTLAALQPLPTHTWTGRSGEPVTAEQVASHLQAVRTLLDTHGWERTDREMPVASLPGRGEMSIKGMVGRLYDAIRDLIADDNTHPRTLDGALFEVGREQTDCDTGTVASHVLDAVITARTGAPTVLVGCAAAWAERVGRTRDDIDQLLATGIEAAHQLAPAN